MRHHNICSRCVTPPDCVCSQELDAIGSPSSAERHGYIPISCQSASCLATRSIRPRLQSFMWTDVTVTQSVNSSEARSISKLPCSSHQATLYATVDNHQPRHE